MEQDLTIPADTALDERAALAERVLLAVRETAAATSRPPTHIKVTAGDTIVELSWAATEVAPANGHPHPASDAGTPRAGAGAGEAGVRHVTSPTVGVFYHAPEPGAQPFVSVGDTLTEGRQVGIVEAMKLMIPVTATEPGRVVEVLVPDGAAVEYGQPLVAYVPPGPA